MVDLRSQIRAIICEIGEIQDAESVTDHADLFVDLGLDSMQAMEIVLEIERRLGLKVTEDDLKEIRSLADAVRVATSTRVGAQ